MPKIKLSESIISKLKCPRSKDEIYYWDAEGQPTGFGVKVRKSGSKSYVYQYRIAGSNKVRKIKIGKYGTIVLKTARSKAMEFAKQVVVDLEDPALKRRERKELPTFEELVDRYINEYSKQVNKPKTVENNIWKFNSVLIPFFKDIPIDKIDSSHLAKLKYQMKNTQVYFNRCYSLLSKMFNLCEIWGIRERNTNPCPLVGRYTKAEKKRKRYLSHDELRKLFAALNEAKYTKNPDLKVADAIINLVYLLIYTGARKGEVLQFQWKNIDWKNKRVKVDSKTGDIHDEANYIELSDYALDIINRAEKAPYIHAEYNKELVQPYMENGKKYNPFIISNPKTGVAFHSPAKAWKKLLKVAGIKDDLRMHDLRHSFASFSADIGVSQKMTGRLLRHSSVSTTQRYIHLFDNKINQATNKIGEYISSFNADGNNSQKESDNTININSVINLTKKENLG